MKHKRQKSSQSTLILLVMLISVTFVILQTRWAEQNKERFINQELLQQLQEINPLQTVRVRCDHCNGRGEFIRILDGEEVREPCPVCKGVSFTRLSINLNTQAICPLCHGLQFIPDKGPHHAAECPQCLGEGLIENQNPYEGIPGPVETWLAECHDCNQTGRMTNKITGKQVPCTTCLGLIYHEVRKFYANDDLCPACGGMGRIVDKTSSLYEGPCERCDGRGVIRTATKELE